MGKTGSDWHHLCGADVAVLTQDKDRGEEPLCSYLCILHVESPPQFGISLAVSQAVAPSESRPEHPHTFTSATCSQHGARLDMHRSELFYTAADPGNSMVRVLRDPKHWCLVMNEWTMHLYSTLLCIAIHPKRFTSWGGGGSLLNHHQCAASTWMMRCLPQDNGASALTTHQLQVE